MNEKTAKRQRAADRRRQRARDLTKLQVALDEIIEPESSLESVLEKLQ